MYRQWCHQERPLEETPRAFWILSMDFTLKKTLNSYKDTFGVFHYWRSTVYRFNKVYIFWEGHKILQNIHHRFDRYFIGQIYDGDFAKFCGLLRIYELYETAQLALAQPKKLDYNFICSMWIDQFKSAYRWRSNLLSNSWPTPILKQVKVI